LYYPGWHAGDKEYSNDELIITYNNEYVKDTKYENAFVLTVLNPKLNIMKNNYKKRNKIGLLVRKCKDFEYKMNLLNDYKHLLKLPIISIDDEINKCTDLRNLSKIYNTISLFME
jgi:hypothetical protein